MDYGQNHSRAAYGARRVLTRQAMVHQKSINRFNWREISGCAFVLTWLALAMVLGSMMARMFEPRGDWHTLGRLNELDAAIPSRFPLIANDDTRVSVWLVYVNGEWRAYDGITPDTHNVHCAFAWEYVTNRFEDPCTGDKFTLEGEYIPNGNYPENRRVQNLNQYVLHIGDGEIAVDLSQRIPGRFWQAISTAHPPE